jgi:hypothetical protein
MVATLLRGRMERGPTAQGLSDRGTVVRVGERRAFLGRN